MSASPARRIKKLTSSGLARLTKRPPLTADELRALRPERILVVRQHNQMGDMVCATPALRAIRETWPAAEIALVTAPVNREVVAHNPDLDRIFNFDRRLWHNPSRLFSFVADLRGFRPELALVLSSISFSVTSAWLAAVSGARYIVGADSKPFGWDVSSHMFSLEMPAIPVMDRHAVDHNLAPLEALGITTANRLPLVVSSPDQQEQARSILAELDLTPGFWALHPGAGKRQNIWPAAGFAEMVRRARQEGHRVLIMHGPADQEQLAAVCDQLGQRIGPDIVVAPACPVGVGAALLQLADRFLCNDTGVMHMAGALRVPTVALFGPTDPALWKPPVPEVVVVRSRVQSEVILPRGRDNGEFGWMENISPDEVWAAWSALPGRGHQVEVG